MNERKGPIFAWFKEDEVFSLALLFILVKGQTSEEERVTTCSDHDSGKWSDGFKLFQNILQYISQLGT